MEVYIIGILVTYIAYIVYNEEYNGEPEGLLTILAFSIFWPVILGIMLGLMEAKRVNGENDNVDT